MGWLEKNFILHERNEKGELLPIDYPVPELRGKTISIIPMTRGELIEFSRSRRDVLERMAKEQADKVMGKTQEGAIKRMQERDVTWENFVLKHIVKPKYTKDDLKYAKLIQWKETRMVKKWVKTKEEKNGKEVEIKKEIEVPEEVETYKDIVMVFLDAIYAVSGIPSIEGAEKELKKK